MGTLTPLWLFAALSTSASDELDETEEEEEEEEDEEKEDDDEEDERCEEKEAPDGDSLVVTETGLAAKRPCCG